MCALFEAAANAEPVCILALFPSGLAGDLDGDRACRFGGSRHRSLLVGAGNAYRETSLAAMPPATDAPIAPTWISFASAGKRNRHPFPSQASSFYWCRPPPCWPHGDFGRPRTCGLEKEIGIRPPFRISRAASRKHGGGVTLVNRVLPSHLPTT